MGNVRDWVRGSWGVLSQAFAWTARDTVAIGIAALLLAVMSRHFLGNEIGYLILSWIGVVIVAIGAWRVFVRGED